jgi:hypothetical protein
MAIAGSNRRRFMSPTAKAKRPSKTRARWAVRRMPRAACLPWCRHGQGRASRPWHPKPPLPRGAQILPRTTPKGRRGASAVEFALILPVVITIVLGCVDFGRFAYTYIAVTNAARVGASFGSRNPVTSVTRPLWEQELRDAVEAEMGSAFDPGQITIPSPVITLEPGGLKRVHVEVSYPFETLVSWPLLPSNIVLTRAVEMRVIR